MRSRSLLQRRFVRPVGLLVAAALAITVSVAGIGPASAATWSGSVSIAANPTATNANAPSSTITVTLSAALVAGYSVSFFDAQGNRYMCATNVGGKVFTQAVAPATNVGKTYRAYVAPTCGTTTAPPSPFTAKSATTASVTNQGWTGTISTVTANPASTDANNRSTVLSVALSKPPAAPYSVSIFDSSGQQYLCKTSTTVSGGWTTPQITIPNASSTTFTAYVAQGCGTTTSPPTTDVRATKLLTVSNLGYTGSASVSAAPASTDANSRNTVLTTTLTKPAPAPYWVSTFSSDGVRYLCSQGPTQTSYSTPQITVPNKATLTFTTYVALSCGTTTTPPGATDGIKATASVNVTSQGYTGAVTLTANPISTNAWNRTTVLTASLSKPSAPPYFVSVFDEAGNRYLCETSSSQPGFLTPAISPPRDRYTTYTAYVATDCGTPTSPPTANVDATSAIDLLDAGWNGDIDVTAAPVEVTSSSPASTITATLSKPLVAPYSLAIYDSSAALLTCVGGSASSASATVIVPNGQQATFTAFVGRSCGVTGARPSPDVVSISDGVTVVNTGWDGRLDLASSGTGPIFTATASLSKPLAAPYQLSIWDDEGGTQLFCSTTTASSGATSVYPPSSGIRHYSAYVAQGCGIGSTPPSADVKGQVTLEYTNGVNTGTGTAGYSDAELIAAMDAYAAAYGAAALCDTVDTLPGTHVSNVSVSDQGQAAGAICRSGGTSAQILKAIKLAGPLVGTGGALVWLITIIQGFLEGPPNPGQPNCNPVCPPPAKTLQTAPGRDAGPNGEYIERLAADIYSRAVTAPTIDEARIAARNCLAQAQYARAVGVLIPGGSSSDPCFSMAILMPGFDTGNLGFEEVEQAAGIQWTHYAGPNVHVYAALTGAAYPDGTHAPRINPSWYFLNYRSEEGSAAQGQWYTSAKWGSPCLAKPSLRVEDQVHLQCDEFPFTATVQASRASSSTRLVVDRWNSIEGAHYGNFVRQCLGGRPQANATSAPFMVAPMVAPGSPPTLLVCSQKRR